MTSGVKGSAGSICIECGSIKIWCRGLCALCYSRAYQSGDLQTDSRPHPTKDQRPTIGFVNTKHDGRSHHPFHSTWVNMIQRCHNPNNPSYHYYGGRGIVVCDRWRKDFWNFVKDMGDRPEGYTLERKNVNGNYTPKNCTWEPWSVQAKNKRPRQKKVKANA